MKRQCFGLLLLASVGGYAQAQSDVFLCVDDSGKKEYKNTGTTKGCKRVELPGLMTIPAPALPKKVVAQTASAKPAANTPSDFPKVDSGTQKARDNDRRQILMDEMKSEEQKLTSLKQEFNGGEPERRGDERNYAKYQERVATLKDGIARTEKNIEALRRELDNMK